MSNRRRRSILKSTRISLGNEVLDETNNITGGGLTGLLPPAAIVSNVSVVGGGRKRVSFGHKQVKEFQLNMSNSPERSFKLPSANETIAAPSDMNISMGKYLDTTYSVDETSNNTYKRNEENLSRLRMTGNQTVLLPQEMDISMEDDYKTDSVDDFMIPQIHPTNNCDENTATVFKRKVPPAVSVVEEGRKRVSFGHKQVKEFQLNISSSPKCSFKLPSANETIAAPSDMNISMGKYLDTTYNVDETSNTNKRNEENLSRVRMTGNQTVLLPQEMDISMEDDYQTDSGDDCMIPPNTQIHPTNNCDEITSMVFKRKVAPLANSQPQTSLALKIYKPKLLVSVKSKSKTRKDFKKAKPPCFSLKTPTRVQISDSNDEDTDIMGDQQKFENRREPPKQMVDRQLQTSLKTDEGTSPKSNQKLVHKPDTTVTYYKSKSPVLNKSIGKSMIDDAICGIDQEMVDHQLQTSLKPDEGTSPKSNQKLVHKPDTTVTYYKSKSPVLNKSIGNKTKSIIDDAICSIDQEIVDRQLQTSLKPDERTSPKSNQKLVHKPDNTVTYYKSKSPVLKELNRNKTKSMIDDAICGIDRSTIDEAICGIDRSMIGDAICGIDQEEQIPKFFEFSVTSDFEDDQFATPLFVENRLDLSQDLRTLITQNRYLPASQRMGLIEQVMREVILMKPEIYEEFQSSFPTTFSDVIWDAIKRHRKIAVRMGKCIFYPTTSKCF